MVDSLIDYLIDFLINTLIDSAEEELYEPLESEESQTLLNKVFSGSDTSVQKATAYIGNVLFISDLLNIFA